MNDDRAGDQKVAAVAASMITAVIPRGSGERGLSSRYTKSYTRTQDLDGEDHHNQGSDGAPGQDHRGDRGG